MMLKAGETKKIGAWRMLNDQLAIQTLHFLNTPPQYIC